VSRKSIYQKQKSDPSREQRGVNQRRVRSTFSAGMSIAREISRRVSPRHARDFDRLVSFQTTTRRAVFPPFRLSSGKYIAIGHAIINAINQSNLPISSVLFRYLFIQPPPIACPRAAISISRFLRSDHDDCGSSQAAVLSPPRDRIDSRIIA